MQSHEKLTAPMREATQAGTGMVESLSKALTEGGLNGLKSLLSGSVLAQLVALRCSSRPEGCSARNTAHPVLYHRPSEQCTCNRCCCRGDWIDTGSRNFECGAELHSGRIVIAVESRHWDCHALPQLIASANACVVQIVSAFVSAAPQLTAGAALISSLASGLAQAMPNVVQAAKSIVPKIAEGITSAIPKLASTAQSLMVNLGRFIEQNFPTLLKTGLEAVVKITGSVRDNAGKNRRWSNRTGESSCKGTD